MKESSRKAVIISVAAVVIVIAAVAALLLFVIPALDKKPAETEAPPPATDAFVGFSSTDELADKHIGVMRGSIYEEVVARYMPEARVSLFDKVADMAEAVAKDEIDAFVCSDIQANAFVDEGQDLKILGVFPEKSEIAFAFPKDDKGAALRDEFNEYLTKIKSDGTLDSISDKWMNSDDRNVEIYSSDGKKGSLKMATTGTTEPYTFMYNGRLVGLDIDIAARFSREYGYDLDISVMEFGSIIPGLAAGTYDFAGANITVTEARSESVYFSDSYTANEIAFVVKSAPAAEAAG